MDTPNEAQTLIILGAERVARVLAEDKVDALAHDLASAQAKIEEQARQIESLTSEKGVLMVDIDNLTKELEALKGGEKDGGTES